MEVIVGHGIPAARAITSPVKYTDKDMRTYNEEAIELHELLYGGDDGEGKGIRNMRANPSHAAISASLKLAF